MTYSITKLCPDCKVAMMPTGIVLLRDPPLYPHKCGCCERVDNLDKIYPLIKEGEYGDKPHTQANPPYVSGLWRKL